MASHTTDAARGTFLVEHYRPGQPVAELERLAALVRAAVEELEHAGDPIRFIRTVVVPGDESFLCVLEAGSEELVRAAYARAGIPFERISAALTEHT